MKTELHPPPVQAPNVVEVLKYYDHPNRDFIGNPLITYFPYLSRDHLRTLLQSDFEFIAEDATHDWELRITYVMRLVRLFLPLDQQVDFAWRLLALMQQNYSLRNPLGVSASKAFYDLCDSIERGKPATNKTASFLASPWCSVLIGTPGMGKTAISKALLELLGSDVLWHKQHGDLYQLPYLTVQAPTAGSGKTLAREVFLKLREKARQTGQPMPFLAGKVPESRTELEHAIVVLAKRLNLGVLVLDELQHLFRGSGAMDQDAMEFLTSVINNMGIPILLIGTWRATGLLLLEGRLARRAVSPSSAFFRRLSQGEEWDAFLTFMLNYQYTEHRVEFTPELSTVLYEQTQGIPDVVVKVLAIAQMEAIASAREELTVKLINEVCEKHLDLIAPMCRHLRNERAEDDPFLWDVEPADFSEYAKKLTANLHVRAVANRKRASKSSQRQVRVDTVAASVAMATSAPPNVAEELAAEAVDQKPTKSDSELVVDILSAARRKGPKPTRSQKRQEAVDAQFLELESEDLRKIVYFASREKSDVAEALDKGGYICHPLEELTL